MFVSNARKPVFTYPVSVDFCCIAACFYPRTFVIITQMMKINEYQITLNSLPSLWYYNITAQYVFMFGTGSNLTDGQEFPPKPLTSEPTQV